MKLGYMSCKWVRGIIQGHLLYRWIFAELVKDPHGCAHSFGMGEVEAMCIWYGLVGVQGVFDCSKRLHQ